MCSSVLDSILCGIILVPRPPLLKHVPLRSYTTAEIVAHARFCEGLLMLLSRIFFAFSHKRPAQRSVPPYKSGQGGLPCGVPVTKYGQTNALHSLFPDPKGSSALEPHGHGQRWRETNAAGRVPPDRSCWEKCKLFRESLTAASGRLGPRARTTRHGCTTCPQYTSYSCASATGTRPFNVECYAWCTRARTLLSADKEQRVVGTPCGGLAVAWQRWPSPTATSLPRRTHMRGTRLTWTRSRNLSTSVSMLMSMS